MCVCIKHLNIIKKTEIIQNLFFHQNGIDIENQLLKDVSKNSQYMLVQKVTFEDRDNISFTGRG